MRELGIEEAKQRLLKMMDELNQICEENGIDISASGGTLLGAVRHKGFIPWDDDIDVYIPRPQYKKLVEIMRERNKISRNVLLCHDLNEKYLYPFAKYVDTKTLLVEKEGYSGVEMGLFIDIFPIDGLGNSIEEAKKQMRKLNKYIILNLSLLVRPWRKNVSFVKNLAISMIRFVAKIIGPNWIHKRMNQIVNSLPYDTSKYVGEFSDEIGDKRIVLKSEMYEEYDLLDFENIKLKAPKQWDKYLTQFYGDYMKLPPVEKRVLTHGYDLFAKEGF